MTLIDNSSKAFFKMLQSIDDLSNVGNGVTYGEVRPGDLTFLDTKSLEGDGFIYLVKIKDKPKAEYHRAYWTDGTITLCCPTDGEVEGAYSPEDITIKGRVTGIYREMPSAPMIDLEYHARLFQTIKEVDVGNYEMTWGEMDAIRARNKGGPMSCIMDAFRYGFLKGQRSEKKRQKAQRRVAA